MNDSIRILMRSLKIRRVMLSIGKLMMICVDRAFYNCPLFRSLVTMNLLPYWITFFANFRRSLQKASLVGEPDKNGNEVQNYEYENMGNGRKGVFK